MIPASYGAPPDAIPARAASDFSDAAQRSARRISVRGPNPFRARYTMVYPPNFSPSRIVSIHLALGKDVNMSRPVILLAVAFCLLPAVTSHAQSWMESPFSRPGFYAGLSGTYAFDQGLSNDIEDSLTEITNAYNVRRGVPCPDDYPPPDGDGREDIWACDRVARNSPIKNFNVVSGDAVGVTARLGYRLRPWFAAEFQVEYVPPMTTTATIENKSIATTPGGQDATQIGVIETMTSTHEMTTGMLNARVILPMGRVQPYMLGGAGFVYAQTTGEFMTYCAQDVQCQEAGTEKWVKYPATHPNAGEEVLTATLYPIDIGRGALESGLDFGFRAGGGIDLYLNEHFVLNWEATAVIPTGKLHMMNYYSFSWGIQYRF
jgi:opacity protein-like surface antigen